MGRGKNALGVLLLVSHDLRRYLTIGEVLANPGTPKGFQKLRSIKCISYMFYNLFSDSLVLIVCIFLKRLFLIHDIIFIYDMCILLR